MGHSPPSETAQTTVTISIASPGVVTLANHGFKKNQAVVLATTSALPTGLTAGTTYYVLRIDSNTFNLAATPSGAAINTSGSQSGTQTISQPATTYRVVRLNKVVTECYIKSTPDTTVTDTTSALAALDAVANTASVGLVALLGSAVAYSTTTKQYSGAMAGNATITIANGAALYALLNTLGTALLAVQADHTGKPALVAAVKAAARAQAPQFWLERHVEQVAGEDVFEYDVISSDDGL